MNELTFLQHCKKLVGNTSARAWAAENLASFFQEVRPDGERLRPLFTDIPSGLDVFQRLREVYCATATGYRRSGSVDAYFIVREPLPSSAEELTQFAIAQLANWRLIAVESDAAELIDMLSPIPDVTVKNTGPPQRRANDTDSLDVFIYDVQTDWHARLAPSCKQAYWMREAFYTIACDYYLARYITWPWYMNATSIHEAYEPYFNLWLRGAELRCASPTDITVYLGGTGRRAERAQ